MTTTEEIKRIVKVTYGKKDELLNLLHSRSIYGNPDCFDDLTFRKCGEHNIEVTLIQYKSQKFIPTKEKKGILIEELKRRGLLPCTFWEGASFYPEFSFSTLNKEKENLISQIGDTHSILLLGVKERVRWVGDELAYIWKGRLDLHYCYQILTPAYPTYYAGYRIIK